jgi:hypothetical protein
MYEAVVLGIDDLPQEATQMWCTYILEECLWGDREEWKILLVKYQ